MDRLIKIIEMVDQQTLRRALGHFATGVVLVTTHDDDRIVCLTANSFTSVSLDPPLILWCLGRQSSRYRYFAQARHFTISVLNLSQRDISARLARSGEHTLEEEHFSRVGDQPPALAEALARFDCEQVAAYPAGDHLIIVGKVTNFAWREEAAPLVYFRGRYCEVPGQP